MTDGIGRIFGGNNYGVGGYVPQRKEAKEEVKEETVVQPQSKDVDPGEVMKFLNANNLFLAPKTASTPTELAPDVQERAVNAMERFEEVYDIVVNEFGEEMAPTVMDLVMDKLMGL